MIKNSVPLTKLRVNKRFTTKCGVDVDIIGLATGCGLFVGVSDTYSSPRLYYEDGTSATPQHSNLVYERDLYKDLQHGDIIECTTHANADAVLRVYKGDGEVYRSAQHFKATAQTLRLSDMFSWKKVGHYNED